MRSVDRSLPAHAGVDHGQEGGWDLHETYTAHATRAMTMMIYALSATKG